MAPWRQPLLLVVRALPPPGGVVWPMRGQPGPLLGLPPGPLLGPSGALHLSPLLHTASSRCILAWSLMLSQVESSTKGHRLNADDEVPQLVLHMHDVAKRVEALVKAMDDPLVK